MKSAFASHCWRLLRLASASSVDAVRANLVAYYTGQNADRTAPRMRDALAALESSASGYAAQLCSDGGWSDVNYGEIPSAPGHHGTTRVANNGNASAVRSGDATGIVFRNAGKVAGAQGDSPAIVYLTRTDLYVTDPTSGAGTFTITLPNGKFTIPRNDGRIFHARLTPSRRRAVR